MPDQKAFDLITPNQINNKLIRSNFSHYFLASIYSSFDLLFIWNELGFAQDFFQLCLFVSMSLFLSVSPLYLFISPKPNLS